MYERDIEKLKIFFEKLEGELKVRFFNLRLKMLKQSQIMKQKLVQKKE